MTKRFRISEPAETKRVPASLGYDEWFEIRQALGMDELANIDRSSPEKSLQGMYQALIVDWSLEDDDGQKLPITPANIREVSRRGLLQGVFEEIGALPFSIQRSQQKSES